MALADSCIKKLILETNGEFISPFVETTQNTIHGKVEPVASYGLDSSGYDVRLDGNFKRFDKSGAVCEETGLNIGDTIRLEPNEFILAETIEVFNIPVTVSGSCKTKSSYARKGLYVFDTSLKPGWCGKLVLELKNMHPYPIDLVIGAGIAFIEFDFITGDVEIPYTDKQTSRFNGQKGINIFDGIKVAGDPNV
jgi:deoxycytidine triphosphate deaminase